MSFDNIVNKNNLGFEIIQSPMFITSRLEFENFASSQKKIIRMASFYQKIRQKLCILTDENNKPIGGKWSFDEENRKKLPRDINIPALPTFKQDKNIQEIKTLVQEKFKEHPGNIDNFYLPTNRKLALQWLQRFLIERLNNFGDYEDAMSTDSNSVFHSLLSPLLNIGLLTPREVVTEAIDFYENNQVSFNSI